jgi:hypothetical protein
VKKPDVIQKNELYFCNQGSNVIQNQLSKSKHRLKSFVLQACVINVNSLRQSIIIVGFIILAIMLIMGRFASNRVFN